MISITFNTAIGLIIYETLKNNPKGILSLSVNYCLNKLFKVKSKTSLLVLIERIKIMKKIFYDLFIPCYLFSLSRSLSEHSKE